MGRTVRVVFEPDGLVADVERGVTVSQAGRAAGVVIPLPCGGRGICTGCGVRVLEGSLMPPDPVEQSTLRRSPADVRLACRARVDGDVTLRPLVAYQVRRPASPASTCSGLAVGVDLGTTTVGAVVLDGQSGVERGRAGAANRQQRWGADVLSRLAAALDGHAAELRTDAEESVLEAIEAASAEAGCGADGVASLAIVGNSAMSALLLGTDVAALAAHPFVAPVDRVTDVDLQSGLRRVLESGARAFVLPAVASFVGGDAIAALVATGILERPRPSLLVDLGTNAEVLLADSEDLVVASAPAGPAFEAAGVACGGPAIEGAVTRVSVDASGAVVLDTIGGSDPAWFCGSGLLSAIASLRALGALDAEGALSATAAFADRVGRDSQGVAFADLSPKSVPGEPCLSVSQLDIRSVQLGKAAVRTGIDGVLETAGVSPESVERVFVAGAFGAAIAAEDLIGLGILPEAFSGRLESVGDASLTGAGMMATEPELAEWASERVRAAVHVDLASRPGFSESLMSAVRLEAS